MLRSTVLNNKKMSSTTLPTRALRSSPVKAPQSLTSMYNNDSHEEITFSSDAKKKKTGRKKELSSKDNQQTPLSLVNSSNNSSLNSKVFNYNHL